MLNNSVLVPLINTNFFYFYYDHFFVKNKFHDSSQFMDLIMKKY